MELECRIHLVMPAQSGVSQRTGNKWMSQEYVLAYHWWPNQTDPSFIVMRVFGEDKIKHFNLQPNDEVKVRFHCEAHENNGRWYNELRIDGVTFVGASAGKNQQPAQQTQQPAANAAETVAQQAPQAEMTEEQKKAMEKLKGMGEQASNGDANGSGDDLPF
jgi:hypothetical protein